MICGSLRRNRTTSPSYAYKPSPVKTKHPNDQSKKRRSLLPTLKSKVKNDRRRDVAHHTYNPNSNGANQKPTTPQPVKVGDVVWHKERKCVVRFLGKTHFGGEITYAGLELYRAIGKNDGAVEGVRYFQCPMNFGLFVPVDTLVQHPPANFSESSAPVTPKQARSFKLLSPKATNKKQAQERTPTSPVHVHTEPQPKQTVASPVSEAPKQLTEDKPQQPPVVMRREKFKGSKKGSRSSMCSPGTTSALTRPQLRHSYSEASTPTNVQPWNLFEEFQLSLQNDKGEPGSALREARSLFNCPSPEPKTEASERIFTTKGDDSPEERPRSHIIPLNDTGDMMSTDMEKYLETIFEAEHSNGNTLDRLDNMPTHRRDRLMPVSASFHDTGEKENLLDEDNKSPKSSEGPLLQDSDHLYDDVPKESDMSSLDDDGEPFNQVADLPESPPVHIPTIERPIMGLAGVDSVVSDDETESLLSSAVDKLKSYENTAPSTLATASPINRPTRPTTLSTKPKKNSLSTTGKQRDISHPSSSLSALNKSQSSSSVNSTAKTQSLRTQRTEVKAKRPLAKPSSKGRIAAPVKRAKSKEKVIENQEPSLPSSISSPRESNLVETEMKEHVILESRFHTFTKNRKQPENLQSTQEYGSLPQMKLTSPAGATFSSKLEQLDQGDKRIIELESEINHLKSANEENEAEFTRLQTSLDASNRGFTAFAVLVQYLTCQRESIQLNAFSIGALEEKVEKLQLNFAVALEQLADAHSERDGALERLDQMTADHLAEVEQLNRSHQEKIRNVEDSLREKMSDDFEQVMVRSRLEREELMSRYETRLALAHKQHQTELAQEEQQHLNLREADRIKYEATLAKLRAKFLDEIDIANTLSQKALEQVTEQRDEIMRNYESLQARNCALEKEINDLSNKRFLEPLPDDVAIDDPRRSGSIPRIPVPPEQIDQEVASLRSVIEIRDEELHRLRRKMADYQLLQEELMTANKEIDTLKRQNEAIQEILDRKKEAEKYQHESHVILRKKFNREKQQNKRLSMERDQLSYQISLSSNPDISDDCITKPSKVLNNSSSVPSTPIIESLSEGRGGSRPFHASSFSDML